MARLRVDRWIRLISGHGEPGPARAGDENDWGEAGLGQDEPGLNVRITTPGGGGA